MCTEVGYDRSILDQVVQRPYELKWADSYIQLLDAAALELLKAGKEKHLQVQGFTVDEDGTRGGKLRQGFLNLNKSQFVARNWEKVYHLLGDHLFTHLYKEFMIFIKTDDHSLVQISGTNIYNFINDRFASKDQSASGAPGQLLDPKG